jgi:butyryl-CoA dehydrogenase
VAIAAQALGIGQAALDEALRHAKSRQAFGRPIAEYEAIQFMLADMSTELDAARMLTYKAAAHKAADTAMQILASAGYRRGSKVERLFRDARATEIYQGTSEAQRLIIADHILGIPRHG